MSAWREDLAACDRRATVGQAIVAWFANPGFVLACYHRAAHWAARRGAVGRVIAVLIERRMVRWFACQISSSARIGPGLRLQIWNSCNSTRLVYTTQLQEPS